MAVTSHSPRALRSVLTRAFFKALRLARVVSLSALGFVGGLLLVWALLRLVFSLSPSSREIRLQVARPIRMLVESGGYQPQPDAFLTLLSLPGRDHLVFSWPRPGYTERPEVFAIGYPRLYYENVILSEAEVAERHRDLSQDLRVYFNDPTIHNIYLSGSTYLGYQRNKGYPFLCWVNTRTMYSTPIVGSLGALMLLVPVWYLRRRRADTRRGCCRRCHYDLRGRPDGAGCPECGLSSPLRRRDGQA